MENPRSSAPKIIGKKIIKINAPNDVQEKIDYAFGISGDPNFVYLLEAENSKWDHLRLSNSKYYRKGQMWSDSGLCQISRYYHPKIVADPRFETDWRWQMRECLRLYRGGTTFYGAANIRKVARRFILK